MSIILDGTNGITLPSPSTLYSVTQIQSAAANTAPVIKDSTGTEIGQFCRAWVNYNAATSTILRSFNVSTVTHSSVGQLTLNFISPMPDANYVVTGSTTAGTSGGIPTRVTALQSGFSTTSALVKVCSGNQDELNNYGAYVDPSTVLIMVFR